MRSVARSSRHPLFFFHFWNFSFLLNDGNIFKELLFVNFPAYCSGIIMRWAGIVLHVRAKAALHRLRDLLLVFPFHNFDSSFRLKNTPQIRLQNGSSRNAPGNADGPLLKHFPHGFCPPRVSLIAEREITKLNGFRWSKQPTLQNWTKFFTMKSN